MNERGRDELDPILADLVDAERQRPAPPDEVAERVHARVLAAVRPGGPPGGSGGGAPARPEGGSGPRGSGGAPMGPLHGLLPKVLSGLLGAAVVAGAAWWALSSSLPEPTSPTRAPAASSAPPASDAPAPGSESPAQGGASASSDVGGTAEAPPPVPAESAPAPGLAPGSSSDGEPAPAAQTRPSTTPRTLAAASGRAAPAAAPPASASSTGHPNPPSELEILRKAEGLASSGDPSQALAEVERYKQTHRAGQLGEEAAALEIELLVKSGAHAEARRKIAEFRRKYPGGAQLPRVLNAESKLP